MNESANSVLPKPTLIAKSWRGIIVAIIILAIIMTSLWFWRINRGNNSDYIPSGPVDVVAMVLIAQSVPVRLQAIGSLRAVNEVTLSSEVNGLISGISFKPGQRVRLGTPLVQLDDTVEHADLAAAKATATFAEQQFGRAAQLIAKGALAKEVYQQRRSELDQAQARIDQLKARIRQKSIRAPFDGELGLRQVNLGQYLNAGDSTVTLTDIDNLYVNFDVPQQELSRIQIGQQVEVHNDIPDAKPLQAKIAAIEPQVDHETRNVTIQALLANTQRTLRPGMYVTIDISLPDEPAALMIPSSAVVTSSSGDTVVVVKSESGTESKKADIVAIHIGRRLGDYVIVTQGLKAGDVVVTEGQVRIQPGAEVRVVRKSYSNTGKE